MKRNYNQNIFDHLLSSLKLTDSNKILIKIIDNWEDIVGKNYKECLRPITITNDVLIVCVFSTSHSSLLKYEKETILEKINTITYPKKIKDFRVYIDHSKFVIKIENSTLDPASLKIRNSLKNLSKNINNV